MQKIFDKWTEKLLDTGKGNKLINFKDSKLRTLEMLSPEIDDLFNVVSNGTILSFYDTDDYLKRFKDEEQELSVEDVKNSLEGNVSANQIFAYKKGFSLKSILRTIKKVSKESVVEKGINILYLAFGFLNWKENENTNINFSSPLVLLPVKLENEIIGQPYELSLYEDEITTNPTLVYKLSSEFGIQLPEFRSEGFEDEGISDYLDRVAEFVKKEEWSVSDKVVLGMFSFLKLNMYKDLIANSEKILSHKTVRKLLASGEELDVENNEIDFDDCFEHGIEETLHNVVDADSSQIQAIIRAKNGQDFVLQGPPGTGKSQTITNLIAEFLYDGKKILFVSEKLAALNVVFNNLKKAGLSDYCLELHSNKANKKDFIDALSEMFTLNKKNLKESAQQELEELHSYKKKLDNYASALYRVQGCIKRTPYQIMGAISKCGNAPIVDYTIKDVEIKDLEFLKNVTAELENYSNLIDEIGSDYRRNCWYGYKKKSITYQEKTELKKDIGEVISLYKKMKDSADSIGEILNTNIQSFVDVKEVLSFLKVLTSIKFYDGNIFSKENLINLILNISKLLEIDKRIVEKETNVLDRFNEDVFSLNLKEYYLKFKSDYSSPFRIFNSKYKNDKKTLNRYLKSKAKIKYNEYLDLLNTGSQVLFFKQEYQNLENDILALFANDENKKKQDWEEVLKDLILIKSVMSKDYISLQKLTKESFKQKQNSCQEIFAKLENIELIESLILRLQKIFNKEICDFELNDFNTLINKMEMCLTTYDELENWIRFVNILEQLETLGVRDFVDTCIDNNVDSKKLSEAFKLLYYTQWMYYIIQREPVLRDFTRTVQDESVAKFKKKDKLKFEISRAEINAKLTSQRPSSSGAQGSQVSVLLREANKKRKQKPVRVLLKEIPALIQTLKPCFLMSPLSVSTYLDMEALSFDVVIFDEASQIFPWDAIGTIARGKQVIVVGDSKQMPPSNFFNAGTNDDEDFDPEDEEYNDSLDFESILDICSSVLNQNQLNWHYRSKTEELIAFSNANFYKNHLVTFPSANKSNEDMGVQFYHVPKGIYDRKAGCNKIEAERVVDLVFEHIQKHPNRSLGVVAFSVHQQEAIEDIIQKRREENDTYNYFFDSKNPEPFFVKNLETVQGDERDTIIFSVGYAKDEHGRFYHNFGPLNRQGGERRLNVAVTRAEYNVKLVASIKSFDIDLGKTSAEGARLLKEYLDYAEHGVKTLEKMMVVDPDAEADSEFELEVGEFLKSKGYKIDLQVGCSGYRIDIGVKHPTKDDYVLAVECDGATYHSGKTTRDRDRLRQEILENLGWKFYRIWSTDWFKNRKTEEKRLLEAVEKAIENFNKTNDIEKDFTSKIEEEIFVVEEQVEEQDLKSMFPKYQEYDIYSKKLPSFTNSVYDLVNMEAPITEELLIKKTATFFGREKVTSVVRDQFKFNIKYIRGIYKVKDYYVVDKNKKIEMRIPEIGSTPRDIMMISKDEIASGMLVVIEKNFGINKEGLFQTINNLLGFNRMVTNISNRLEESLQQLLDAGLVREEKGEYFIS